MLSVACGEACFVRGVIITLSLSIAPRVADGQSNQNCARSRSYDRRGDHNRDELLKPSALALAAWRCSPQSFDPYRVLAQLPTELFDEILSGCQIGKASAVEDLPLPSNRTSVMWLNVSRLMEIYDLAA